MILPQTHVMALLLMIFGTLLLGAWAGTYKLGDKWRFELFYLDFAIGASLAAVIYAFTAGDLGFDGFSILDDISHARKRQLLCAFVAGTVFNLANIFLVAAISQTGMALAFPMSLGMGMLVGVLASAGFRQAASPQLLAIGCAAVAFAVIAGVLTHRAAVRERYTAAVKQGTLKRTPASLKGPILAIVSGLALGGMTPLLETAREGETGLGPYSLMLLMAAGIALSSLVYILFFMNLPVEGEPLEIADILKVRPKLHLLGLLGGALWTSGVLANTIPQAQNIPPEAQPGPALSFALTQASALVAALLGIGIWKELRGTGRARGWAAGTLALFTAGVGLICWAILTGKRS